MHTHPSHSWASRHKKKIIGGHSVAIVALLASSALTLNGGLTVLYFAPHGNNVLTTSEITEVDVNINTKLPINAVGATITFPPEIIEIVSISKAHSFLDLWTEDTVIREDKGEVRFSGGTIRPGGMVGTGTVLTLTVRAKKTGDAQIAFKDVNVYSSDGTGTEIESQIRPIVYSIPSPVPQGLAQSPTQLQLPSQEKKSPSPDLDNDGKITLVDFSIMTIKILMPYNARYDLDQDGLLGLSDLSILFAKK